MKLRINFIGWYGMKNIGDDSFETVFREAFYGHDLIFSQKPDRTADVFVLGGGGVIDDGYFDGLDFTKPIYAVGVDIPLSGDKYRLITGTPFRKIFVRSKEYFWLGREQGIKNISYMPDLAFWLSPPKRRDSAKLKLGVSLTQNLLAHEDHAHVQDHIGRVLARKRDQFEIVFLVFKSQDEEMALSVISKHPIPCKIIKPDSPRQMLEQMSELSALITMRFHGAVFAHLCKVPFLSLSTPGKHSLFCEQEALHDSFLDFRDVNEYKLLAALNRMLSFKERGDPENNHHLVRAELAKIRSEIEAHFGGSVI